MRYSLVRQHSEEDCGAACLATIVKHYGRNFAVSRVREAVGTGARGTTLLGLNRGADVLGFHVRQVRASPQLVDRLNEVPMPAIIHWKGNHWVVLYGQKRKKYVIADPGRGIRYLTLPVRNWSGVGAMGLCCFYNQMTAAFINKPTTK
jgi:ABC-type bacteriocin/lantibiotic exporter with double-glycine peptidase domain